MSFVAILPVHNPPRLAHWVTGSGRSQLPSFHRGAEDYPFPEFKIDRILELKRLLSLRYAKIN